MSHSVVIGGAGFIGSWIVKELLKDPNSQITIIDNLISSEPWNIELSPRIRFIRGSASDLTIFEKINTSVDFIYQMACYHGNQNSLAKPFESLEHSLGTTIATLECMRKRHHHARFIYASAGCALAPKTWEKPNPTPEIENTSIHHDTPYSISKISGEMYCLLYKKQFNLNTVILRFQNVYGPREILGAGTWRGTSETIWRNVIPSLIWKSLNNLPLHITPNATRDFIYVEDLVSNICKIANNNEDGGIYNLGSGKETSIKEIANLIVNFTNSHSQIFESLPRNWDNSGRRVGDIQKVLDKGLLSEITTLDKGIKKTIDWTKTHKTKIQIAISKHGKSSETI